MQIGTQIVLLNNATTTLYTPWFPKMADNGVFAYEVIASYLGSSGGNVSVAVYTKNREDQGGGTSAGTLSDTIATGFKEKAITGLKELVRLEITVTPGTSITGPAGVIYRILPPTWYNTAV